MADNERVIFKREVTTAILVDGAFYRRRAYNFWGEKSPTERADELYEYCMGLLHNKREQRNLYRLFYYDCPPIDNNVFHPIQGKTVNLGKTPDYKWMNDFFQELRHKRKVALRLGNLSTSDLCYNIKPESFKKLLSGDKSSRTLMIPICI